jgi:hypothetical protein
MKARATRISLPIAMTYRIAGESGWNHSRILNVSESGVLFGPTGLAPGTSVELAFSLPMRIGSLTVGRLVRHGRIVRVTELAAVGARFEAAAGADSAIPG